MSKSINNSINLSIFSCLKVSELSKVPALIISSPGMGKSSTVEMFAKIRGYELVLLRGNSESAESILGYDAVGDVEKHKNTVHLRPEWFQRLLNFQAQGKKTLLFLDEITTCSEFVQAALLHLIFERKVGWEDIPEDTLIVSAGNYASNLSNSMVMLPPLLNRFMIYNIIPSPSDIDSFLNNYEGSISHKRIDKMGEIAKQLEAIDSQEKTDLTPEQENMIGEYIERSIRMTAKMLMTSGEKPVDIKVTDLQTLYSDVDNDDPLPNFVTPRTLCYAVRVTVAAYKAFGKAGITSDNYRNMMLGLVGLGLSRDSKKNGEVKKTLVVNEFVDDMAKVVNDIEKMNNNKITQYESFLRQYVVDDGKCVFETSKLNALSNKFKEIMNDKDLGQIERPVDPSVIESVCKILVRSAKSAAKYKIDPMGNSVDNIPVESFCGNISYWNNIADLMINVTGLTGDSVKNYSQDTKKHIKDTQTELRQAVFKLKTIKKFLTKKDAALVNIIPEIKSVTL